MVFTSNSAALGIIIPSDRNLMFWVPCSVDMLLFMCSCCHHKYCLNDLLPKKNHSVEYPSIFYIVESFTAQKPWFFGEEQCVLYWKGEGG